MNKTPFETKCMSFFGYHRVFMNRVQIQQAAEYFCSKWNIQTYKNSSCITCSYSKPIYQSSMKGEGKTESSQFRKLISCPFIIRYGKVEFKRNSKQHNGVYSVYVTSIIAKHTCLMSNSTYRVAKKTSHSSKLNLTEVSTAVNYLKINPHLEARQLRNILKDCIPASFHIDSTFLNNFRRRVAIHHAKHPDSRNLTHDVATHLTKRCNLKTYEIEELEDPIIRNNFRTMYK